MSQTEKTDTFPPKMFSVILDTSFTSPVKDGSAMYQGYFGFIFCTVEEIDICCLSLFTVIVYI